MLDRNISGTDRLISAGTYMTGGLIGIIWQVFSALRGKSPSRFLMFNVFQSIFFSILLFFVSLIFSFAIQLLLLIPFINKIVSIIALKLFSPIYHTIYYNFSIISFVIFVIYLYLVVCSIAGKYAYIPWVSKIITYHIDRY